MGEKILMEIQLTTYLREIPRTITFRCGRDEPRRARGYFLQANESKRTWASALLTDEDAIRESIIQISDLIAEEFSR